MRIISLSFLLILILFLAIPASVHALDLRTGRDLNISSSDGDIEENVYVAGATANIDTNVKGDLSLLSGQAIIDGKVEEDVIVAGGEVTFNGEIVGDLRIVGGDVVVNGKVSGNTVVVGGEVTLASDANLEGDIFVVGGRVTIDSSISSYTKIVSGHVLVNGDVPGDITITTQQLIFGENSDISGTVTYFSPVRVQMSDNAKVSGTLNYNQISSIRDSNIFKQVVLSFINFWMLLRFVTTLLVAFLLVYVFKVFSQKVTDYATNSFGMSLIIGLLSIVLIPILSAVLFASLIALPISILLMLSLIFIMIISSAVAGIILGVIIKKVFKKDEPSTVSFQTATLGVVLLTVLQFVPFVGDLTRMLFFFVAVGAIVHHVYSNIRFNKV